MHYFLLRAPRFTHVSSPLSASPEEFSLKALGSRRLNSLSTSTTKLCILKQIFDGKWVWKWVPLKVCWTDAGSEAKQQLPLLNMQQCSNYLSIFQDQICWAICCHLVASLRIAQKANIVRQSLRGVIWGVGNVVWSYKNQKYDVWEIKQYQR